MTREQAARQSSRLLGKGTKAIAKKKPSSADQRDEALARHKGLVEEEQRLEQEYQTLLVQHGLDKLRQRINEVHSKASGAFAESRYYQFSIEVRDPEAPIWGVRTVAEGDTWDEVLGKLSDLVPNKHG